MFTDVIHTAAKSCHKTLKERSPNFPPISIEVPGRPPGADSALSGSLQMTVATPGKMRPVCRCYEIDHTRRQRTPVVWRTRYERSSSREMLHDSGHRHPEWLFKNAGHSWRGPARCVSGFSIGGDRSNGGVGTERSGNSTKRFPARARSPVPASQGT